MSTTKTPQGLGVGGTRLWRAISDGYELGDHERALLIEICRTVDVLDVLDEEIRRVGAMVETPQGRMVSRAVTEARQQKVVLGKLLAGMRIPDDDRQDSGRPQRRGLRGPYGVRGA